jgi:hypothetical protein
MPLTDKRKIGEDAAAFSYSRNLNCSYFEELLLDEADLLFAELLLVLLAELPPPLDDLPFEDLPADLEPFEDLVDDDFEAPADLLVFEELPDAPAEDLDVELRPDLPPEAEELLALLPDDFADPDRCCSSPSPSENIPVTAFTIRASMLCPS